MPVRGREPAVSMPESCKVYRPKPPPPNKREDRTAFLRGAPPGSRDAPRQAPPRRQQCAACMHCVGTAQQWSWNWAKGGTRRHPHRVCRSLLLLWKHAPPHARMHACMDPFGATSGAACAVAMPVQQHAERLQARHSARCHGRQGVSEVAAAAALYAKPRPRRGVGSKAS